VHQNSIIGTSMMGCDTVLARPKEMALGPEVIEACEGYADRSGASFRSPTTACVPQRMPRTLPRGVGARPCTPQGEVRTQGIVLPFASIRDTSVSGNLD
jgi:hypothetical protein